MLEVLVNLVPHGDVRQRKPVAVIGVTNDLTTPDDVIGNYTYTLVEYPVSGHNWSHDGKVIGHPRIAGALALVKRVLDDADAGDPADAKFAGFGREVMQWILDSEYWWDDERSEDIMPMAIRWGLAERVPYCIDLHGEGIEASEGDEIWWIDPKKWPLLPTEIYRLRADIERLGRERDQMIAANVELQERLSKLGDDGK